MKHNFTKLPYVGRRSTTRENSITLSKSGRIGLNAQFVQKHGVTPTDRANLYWDNGTKSLAFAFVPADDSGAYPVAGIGSETKARYINAIKFFQAAHIDPAEHAGEYDYKVLDADEAGIGGNREAFLVSLNATTIAE